MKKYVLLLVFLCVFMYGCGMAHSVDNTVEESPWINLQSNPEIYLRIMDDKVDALSTEINVQIVNGSKYECIFSEKIFLEKEHDGIWYSLAEIYNSLESAFIINPGTSFTWSVPLCEKDTMHSDFIIEKAGESVDEISLLPGHYRMVVVLYRNGIELPIGEEMIVEKYENP